MEDRALHVEISRICGNGCVHVVGLEGAAVTGSSPTMLGKTTRTRVKNTMVVSRRYFISCTKYARVAATLNHSCCGQCRMFA